MPSLANGVSKTAMAITEIAKRMERLESSPLYVSRKKSGED
jgi:hypothetical protein